MFQKYLLPFDHFSGKERGKGQRRSNNDSSDDVGTNREIFVGKRIQVVAKTFFDAGSGMYLPPGAGGPGEQGR
jgi:hypothetical protein